MNSPNENEVVTGSGTSEYALQVGEGPSTNEPQTRQEGNPTILSHDLGSEGFEREIPHRKPPLGPTPEVEL